MRPTGVAALGQCSFTTDRLAVAGWHQPEGTTDAADDLAVVVAAMLTPAVTHALPPGWQGQYTPERATRWIIERDLEGQTLLVVDRATSQAIGLVMLHESAAADGAGVDIRLGYLLAEAAWGNGFGSELVAGFVTWCRQHSGVRSISGGVAAENMASARILEKNGFVRIGDAQADPGAEATHELILQP